jgi:hypothetical protein
MKMFLTQIEISAESSQLARFPKDIKILGVQAIEGRIFINCLAPSVNWLEEKTVERIVQVLAPNQKLHFSWNSYVFVG